VSKNTKKDKTQKVTENALPTQTPFPSSHINQTLHIAYATACCYRTNRDVSRVQTG